MDEEVLARMNDAQGRDRVLGEFNRTSLVHVFLSSRYPGGLLCLIVYQNFRIIHNGFSSLFSAHPHQAHSVCTHIRLIAFLGFISLLAVTTQAQWVQLGPSGASGSVRSLLKVDAALFASTPGGGISRSTGPGRHTFAKETSNWSILYLSRTVWISQSSN